MSSTTNRIARRTLLAGALAIAGGLGVSAPAAAAPAASIDVPSVAFGAQRVDVTAGMTSVALSWTVTDTSGTASQVRGAVTVQQYIGGDPVGYPVVVRYSLNPEWPALVFGGPGSTVARSNYSYQLQVPQYAGSAKRTWRVTQITASDNQGGSDRAERGDGGLAQLQVTGLVDSTAPTIGFFLRDYSQPDVIFDDGSGVTLNYSLEVNDPESGFWKGSITLRGAANTQVTAPIQLVDNGGGPQCGQTPMFDPTDVWCDLQVKLPVGSPSGTWSVASIRLTDNAGVSHTYTDMSPEPFVVTRNDILSASGFALSPSQVDNWRESQTLRLSMVPAGVRGGLTTVIVRADECDATAQTPEIGADGTAAIPVEFFYFTRRCQVNGIELIDGAGDVAVYGSYFAAPPLNLTATTTPDTTPPVALAATLSQTVRLTSDTNSIGVDVTVDDTTGSPIDAFSVTLYNAAGVSVGGGDGGISTGPDGMVHLSAFVRQLPVGTYTAGFTLYDTADNQANYGYPGGHTMPAPSGPLVLTVIDG